MDYTDIFTTHTLFDTREELLSWVCEVARKHNIVIVVRRSNGGKSNKKGRVFLGCERGGEYRPYRKIVWKPNLDVDVNDKEGESVLLKKQKKRET
ncbi:hypothetical protein ACS0TY_034033 [Phlomoides rotata]